MKQPSLTEVLADLRKKIGDPYRSLNDQIVQRLIESEFTSRALKAGDACPPFALASAEGALVRSEELLGRAPIVLSFYRGVWCPFCSAELEALHEADVAIRAAGGTVVAVSPEVSGLALKVKRERDFKFEILIDADNGLALAFGLVHPISRELIDAFRNDGLSFPLIYGNDSWLLPLPATYVIGGDGSIIHAYVNPEFRERLDPERIISLLRELGATR